MKIIRARIKNFRILKNLDIEFSTDPKRKLTVIRAANETGKTTIQQALIWCLYGSKAFSKRRSYTLFPTDYVGIRDKVEVSVEIDFVTEEIVRQSRTTHTQRTTRYRLRRLCIEGPPSDDGVISREMEKALLFEITDSGVKSIEDGLVDDIIQRALPITLKDVYFTDGDSALSFIESTISDRQKSERVRNAIESLLGLRIIENTINHLGRAEQHFSQEIDNVDHKEEADRLNSRIIFSRDEIVELQEELDGAQEEYNNAVAQLKKKNEEIDELLRKGDKEQLINKRNMITREIDRLKDLSADMYKNLARLNYSELTSRLLLKGPLSSSKEILFELSQNKQLPKVHVPVLEELLERDSCFCGGDLKNGIEAEERKAEIKSMIEKSLESDRIQESATDLFYRSRGISIDDLDSKWMSKYVHFSDQVQNIDVALRNKENDLNEIQKTIEDIDDSSLEVLREQAQKCRQIEKESFATIKKNSVLIEEQQTRIKEAEQDLEKIRSRMNKKDTAVYKLDIATDTRKVFEVIKERLTNEELKKVSEEMNRIFLAMIGMNSEETTTNQARIACAVLTENFDIKAYSQNNTELDPDEDLNGASRRAITLAFILALTKVSEVDAPNIIDTPLGMMSGYVKQSVLLNTIQEGSQIILFLTHDEIRGVEEIIDAFAGEVYTLTNPAHYPVMLVNEPEDLTVGITRCSCNHREHCDLCERKQIRESSYA